MMAERFDVVVVGGGNAGLCAALSARHAGASVLVLERAPQQEAGGNSAFTSGAMRVAYDSTADLVELIDEVPDEQLGEPISGTTRPRRSSTTSPALPNIAAIRNSPRSSLTAASRRCGGCAVRACGSYPSTADSPSRSTAASCSGGIWSSRRRAVARQCPPGSIVPRLPAETGCPLRPAAR